MILFVCEDCIDGIFTAVYDAWASRLGHDNVGLRVAEIELPAENTPFEKPEWAGQEVSGDARYYNSSLIAHPYCLWKTRP